MIAEALRYPLRDSTTRDAFAVSTGLVLVALLLVRVGTVLWPDVLAAAPVLLLVVPASLFGGYLAAVLRAGTAESATPAFRWSTDTLRVGGRFLTVAVVYSLPAVVALVATAYVLLQGASGMLLTLAPTVALLATVASVYVLPAALAVGTRDGVLAVLTRGRTPFRGLASGSYFFAWTVATSLVVTGWSLLAAVGPETPAAILVTVLFVYAHVSAARLLSEGLERSPWSA